VKIVASASRLVQDSLTARNFRAAGAESLFVDDAGLFERVREGRPQLVVLAEGEGHDGLSLCARLKRDSELRTTRVIVVVDRDPAESLLGRLTGCGCDELVLARLGGEEIYPSAARLCGLPELSLSAPADVRDPAWSTPSVPRRADAANLQPRSVDLLSERPLSSGARVLVTLRRDGDPAPALEIEGDVARSDGGSGRPFRARVKFGDMPSAAQQRLHDLALWDARRLGADTLRVDIRGAFDQASDFAALTRRISDDGGLRVVVFDLSRVRQITSWGAREWILFLRGLPAAIDYRFVNGSTLFSRHCSMVADMLGRGEVLTLGLPYECASCGAERARLVHVAWLTPRVRSDPPPFRCSSCGEEERFAELPDRFFSFLRA
jgi:CheY-like chemotaxis protein